jgi:hypothetical protein
LRLRLAPLFLALCAALAIAAPASAASPSSEQFTPVVGQVLRTPEPVLASDGHVHLAYELLVVNRPIVEYGFVSAAASLQRVQVLDERGKVLLSLSGKKLADLTDRFGAPEPGTKLEPGQSGFVAIDVTLPRGAKVPSRLTHRFSIALHPDQGVEATTYETGPSAVSKRQATVLAAPVRGAGWIVNDGCCATLTPHRRGVLPVNGAIGNGGRFSINLVRIQANGNVFTTPPKTTSDYSSFPYFGEPVYSVAGGTVVSVVNNLPENPLGTIPAMTPAEIGGNGLVVKMGPGRYVYYGRLKTGSIVVHPGQQVKAGQVVGQIGSSGYTTGPTFHIGLLDGPDPLASEGIPFRFNRFSVAGTLTNYTGIFEGKTAVVRPELLGEHVKQMPLDQQVLSFP